MDKHAIIKLKEEGHSNRKVAAMLHINRKTVAKYWNEHCKQLEMLYDDANLKATQEKICTEPKYDIATRKSRKYTDEIDLYLDEILSNEAEKLKVLKTNKQQLTQLQIYELIVDAKFMNINSNNIKYALEILAVSR